MKSGMDAVIAKSSKRPALFKRKLAEKLESAPAKSASYEKPFEKPAAKAKSGDAQYDALEARIAKLEAMCSEDDD